MMDRRVPVRLPDRHLIASTNRLCGNAVVARLSWCWDSPLSCSRVQPFTACSVARYRGSARKIGVRLALGAKRSASPRAGPRVQSLVLAAVGGVAGLVASFASRRLRPCVVVSDRAVESPQRRLALLSSLPSLALLGAALLPRAAGAATVDPIAAARDE